MRTLTPRSSASDLKQDCHRPRKISSLDRYCNRGYTFDAGSSEQARVPHFTSQLHNQTDSEHEKNQKRKKIENHEI
jgi:hypothetical protein